MISTVAVGTDGSPTAAIALDAAMDVAERYGARLVVLSAYRSKPKVLAPDAFFPLESQWVENLADAVRTTLAEAEELARARGLEVASEAGDGDAADVLADLAERHGADLLVIGNKGIKRKLLGSVPSSVSQQAPCSVWIVKTT
jgi:nucleotide-binding universal stress UspA family protein